MRSTQSRFRAGAAVVAGTAAVVLAACGGGSDDGAGGSDRDRFREAALEHARCMREHGVDVPDPKPGKGGIVLVGPEQAGDPARAERAIKACEKHLRDLPPPKLSEEQKAEMRKGALAHARCMRAEGIDMPDPQFGPDGSITMRIEGEDAPNPDDPKVRAAQEKCSKHMPELGEAREPGGTE
jgi:hypothetical protein